MPEEYSAASQGKEPRFPTWKLGQEPVNQLVEVVLLWSAKDEGGSKIFGGEGGLMKVFQVQYLSFFPNWAFSKEEFAFP